MITDEQVNAFINSFELNGGHFLGNNEFDNVRKALEAYEASKWVRFDADNESTYPPFDVRVLTKLKGDFGVDMSIDFMTHSFEWYNSISLRYVSHWQYLPTFKE